MPMLLNCTIRCWKPRILRLGHQAVHHSTQASAGFKPYSWQPFPAPNFTVEETQLEYNAAKVAMQKKRKLELERYKKQKKVFNPATHRAEGTNEEVLAYEIHELLMNATSEVDKVIVETETNDTVGQDDSIKGQSRVEMGKECEVKVVELSSTGDGLAYSPTSKQIFIVPFGVPGDTVLVKPYRETDLQIQCDMVRIVQPSQQREGTTPNCKYFGECSGCQLQMISYEDQLKHKKTIVEKAFKFFSGLTPDRIPKVDDTMGSPLQYGYRTKLTPHFSMPRGAARTGFKEAPPMGFNRKGRPSVLDIEHCPIGTKILQEGLSIERAKMKSNLSRYKNGATVLLRESTERIPKYDSELSKLTPTSELNFDAAPVSEEIFTHTDGTPEHRITFPTHSEYKTYTSSEVEKTTEYIGPYRFTNMAGSFFQNNNSILRPFTSYVYDQCIPKPASSSSTSTDPKENPIKYLLDAYCGSGLFTITLSPIFSSALGIDIDRRGIEAARQNAEDNLIPNAGFIEADASDLFADVPFPPEQSLVVIDPPRKGASKDFLTQLCRFGAKRLIYVSCNVHTQARDVGMIVNGFDQGWRYEIESLKGFDFFPQTGHVEGVCVLNRVEIA